MKKSNFLKKMIKRFELNAEVMKKNIFEERELEADIIVARAFKPLQTILELINKNFSHYNVYQIEGEGKKLFSEIKGDKNTIMGLPIIKIKSYLQEHE